MLASWALSLEIYVLAGKCFELRFSDYNDIIDCGIAVSLNYRMFWYKLIRLNHIYIWWCTAYIYCTLVVIYHYARFTVLCGLVNFPHCGGMRYVRDENHLPYMMTNQNNDGWLLRATVASVVLKGWGLLVLTRIVLLKVYAVMYFYCVDLMS